MAKVLLALVLIGAPHTVFAQEVRGVVLDQTGLPLPGATVQLLNGVTPVASVVTQNDGTFLIDAALPGDAVRVSLDGFEPLRVVRRDAARIVLQVARTSQTTTVVAPAAGQSAAAADEARIGGSLTADTVARMPSSHMKARESLPLLPSVIRGPDGLMQLGGARAHETPLLLDGFNITNPATGISSVNLPFEAVGGIEALRDPMSVSYGGLLGGLVRMESKAGGDHFAKGVQGFIPRPRLTSPGFGRLEGIFPRGFAAGSTAGGRFRFMTAAEYDYERIPVPGVTQGRGPDIVEDSSIAFARVDAQVTPRNVITVEGFGFTSGTRSAGLSPRRDASATSNLNRRNWFLGITHRFLAGPSSVVTVHISAQAHNTALTPNGDGLSYLSPSGWTGNWFATASRTSSRQSVAATWERSVAFRGGTHDLTFNGEMSSRRLNGRVAETSVVVSDADGRTVRSVDFGAPSTTGSQDRPGGLAIRDFWHVTDQVLVDAGLRVDYSPYGGASPSARLGVRYALDPAGTTVVKAGYGSFIGNMPLSVSAFGGYPQRVDRWIDPDTGGLIRDVTLRPAVGSLQLPRAVTATFALERQITRGLDAQVVLTNRHSSRLAVLRVPTESGNLTVESSGISTYREIQLSARRSWINDQQLFVSYVRSYGRGELNDFAALFRSLDAPLVQPGGAASLSTDARNRVLMWGTFNLPRRVVVSPVFEWHSGFPYSFVDARNVYVGTPNSASFPAFFSADLVVYKTVTVRKRTADLGVQIFNLINHRNPRDVHPVVGAPHAGEFTNSVGPIIRGYMLLKW